MIRRQGCRWWVGVAAMAMPLGAALAANEARTFAGTVWDGYCPGTTRYWWDDMCDAWSSRMREQGWSERRFNEKGVRASQFADSAAVPWGNDNAADGADQAEASLFCGHGGFNSRGWFGWYPGGEKDICRTYPDQMRLGGLSGGKVRFMQLSSCNSVRWEYRDKWLAAAKNVHLVAGFHGLMYIGPMFVDEYRALADDGYSRQGVGRAWVEDTYHNEPWYTGGFEICPVSLAFGHAEYSAQYTLDESYYSGWPDMPANAMATYYVSGCIANGAGALP